MIETKTSAFFIYSAFHVMLKNTFEIAEYCGIDFIWTPTMCKIWGVLNQEGLHEFNGDRYIVDGLL